MRAAGKRGYKISPGGTACSPPDPRGCCPLLPRDPQSPTLPVAHPGPEGRPRRAPTSPTPVCTIFRPSSASSSAFICSVDGRCSDRGEKEKRGGVRSRGTPSPIPLTRPAGHVSQREVLGVLPDTEGERRTHDAAGGHRVRPGRADPIPNPSPPRVATQRPAPSPDVDEAGGGEVHALGEELQQPHAGGQPQRPAGSRGRVRRGLWGGTRPLHQGWGPHRLGEPRRGSHFWSVTM